MNSIELNHLSREVIGAAIEVHKVLGPGLLEPAYKRALAQELKLRGINAVTEYPVPLVYKGCPLGNAFSADLLVENELVVELKAVDRDSELFCNQLKMYLKLLDKRLGLLINFHNSRVVDGVTRIVNNFVD